MPNRSWCSIRTRSSSATTIRSCSASADASAFCPSWYVVAEYAPRLAGYDPDTAHISFGVEGRAGGHLFQINFSNDFATTYGQIARGALNNDDWFIGFNISRKFF